MFGKVREVQSPGELMHECVVIDVDKDMRGMVASISRLSFDDYNRGPVEAKDVYKLDGDLLRKGDVVMLHTGSGAPSTRILPGNRTLHLQYLNMGSAIWDGSNCRPVLSEITYGRSI